MPEKPLKRKAYGSIGHLPNSRLGPGDHCVPEGMARICTEKTRDKHDLVIVQEKLDGSCTAVAKINGEIVALGRAGWRAGTSPYRQHQMFAAWVAENWVRFDSVLNEGERLVGEWVAQAHGTLYHNPYEPWGVFDLMREADRVTYEELDDRIGKTFCRPMLLHRGGAVSVDEMYCLHQKLSWPCNEVEGVVYRVERKGKVDFLAKWVRPDKVDGKYLSSVSGKPDVWNWRPTNDETKG